MLFALLGNETSTGTEATGGTGGGMGSILTWVFLGLLIVAIIVMFVISSRRNKKRQQEAENLINAVKPGNKVKTIGGVCGICVEVDEEENTFVLETGSETTGKCYMKFDRQAIYQTDAVVEGGKTEEAPAAEEAPAEQASEPVEVPESVEKTEDAPADES